MDNKGRAKELRQEYGNWAENNFRTRAGFFPVFYSFKDHLCKLSSGAVSLFLYFGMHCNNKTGESYHEIPTIARFFKKSPRTITAWLTELEQNGLIERFQLEFGGVSHTFIRPYQRKETDENHEERTDVD